MTERQEMRAALESARRLITRTEIAKWAKVARPAVTNWERRYVDFPKPVPGGETEYFQLQNVLDWLDGRRVPANRLIGDELPGTTYGDRVRRELPDNAPLTAVEETSNRDNARRLRGLLTLADAVRGSAAMADYLTLLLTLNFLRVAERDRWARLHESALRTGGTKQAKDLLRRIGHAADEALRWRGVPPGLQNSLVRLTPRAVEDLTKVVRLSAGLGRETYEQFLGMYEEQVSLRSGEFLTPSTLTRLMADLVLSGATRIRRVYDPYARGGELLVATASAVSGDVDARGESPRLETLRYAAMYLAVSGTNASMEVGTATPWEVRGNRPMVKADVIVTNPPFNMASTAGERTPATWPYGEPPTGNDNFAWLQHILQSLVAGGRAAVIMPQSAGTSVNPAEQDIRRNMVNDGVVECVIALPSELFASTDVPVSVWLLRKQVSPDAPVLFIDARKRGTKLRNRRILTSDDRDAIVTTYRRLRDGQASGGEHEASDGFGVLATFADIRAHDFSLNPANYLTDGLPDGAVGDPGAVVDAFEQLAEAQERTNEVARAVGAHAAALVRGTGGTSSPLPDGWIRTTLAEVCEIQAGSSYSHLRNERRSPDGDVPLVRPRNLRDGHITDTDQEKVSAEFAALHEHYLLEVDDIVCIRSGALAPPALVRTAQKGWLPHHNLFRLRARWPEVFDPLYLLGFLSQPNALDWVRNRSASAGARSISGRSFGELPVVLPPMSVQRRVAAMLHDLDLQISLHRCMVTAATDTRALLTKGLMSGALTFDPA
ncbi:N-6 DNA methylase [Nonomuraea sp. SMC257]|uniref:N-6 DNA methylase n=1 Tax=Nonomuraea montanisoli TaxID=2741721 RepID=A0A7Y6M845_9ACTN|nr:type I restriction-modification system subunit M/S [Nonomuraea montanisoli]NUW37340.1 N-6 DNA methylase [Nonomuraea montanisoli]